MHRSDGIRHAHIQTGPTRGLGTGIAQSHPDTQRDGPSRCIAADSSMNTQRTVCSHRREAADAASERALRAHSSRQSHGIACAGRSISRREAATSTQRIQLLAAELPHLSVAVDVATQRRAVSSSTRRLFRCRRPLSIVWRVRTPHDGVILRAHGAACASC